MASVSQFDPPTVTAHERARTASTLGLVCVGLVLLAPCASCLPMVFALPLALVALRYARDARLGHEDDPVVEAHVRNATATSVMAALYSALVLLLVASYFMLYIGIIALAIATS